MKRKLTAQTIIVSLAIAAGLSCSAARADKPIADYFSRNTSIPKTDSKVPQTIFKTETTTVNGVLHKSPALSWYERLDQEIISHMPSVEDKVALTKPLPNPPTAESVNKWKATAQSMANKYRELARILRIMPIGDDLKADPQSKQLETYRTLLAQWYDDSAAWLEDYIKPRAPARSIEELNDQLNAMHVRSVQLKESMAHLQEMDSGLRQYFRVHSKFTDPIQMIVNKKLPSQQ